MKKQIVQINFQKKTLHLIDQMNGIIKEYREGGYPISLRQLYYQMVSRDYIENSKKSYDRIKAVSADARYAGLMDIDALTDRGRSLRSYSKWDSPADVINSAAYSFQLDLWQGQPYYVEVWVEKDALVDVVGRGCRETRTPHTSCRGFTSIDEIQKTATRLQSKADKEVIILHLSDHDPSGVDMTRDLEKRITDLGAKAQIKRIGLLMAQVQQYNPPPNYAKETDTRYPAYKKLYGEKCWELDALRPEVIESLVDSTIKQYLDLSQFEKMRELEREQRQELWQIANNYAGALAGATA